MSRKKAVEAPAVVEEVVAPPPPKPIYKVEISVLTPTGSVGHTLELPPYEGAPGDFYDWLGNEVDRAVMKAADEGVGYKISESLQRFAK